MNDNDLVESALVAVLGVLVAQLAVEVVITRFAFCRLLDELANEHPNRLVGAAIRAVSDGIRNAVADDSIARLN